MAKTGSSLHRSSETNPNRECLFSPCDDDLAVTHHALAESRFGGAASAVGRAVLINNLPFTVLGVTPLRKARFWLKKDSGGGRSTSYSLKEN